MDENKDAYDGVFFYPNFARYCFLNHKRTSVTLRQTRQIHGRSIFLKNRYLANFMQKNINNN